MNKLASVARVSSQALLLVLALACNAAIRPAHALDVAGVKFQPQSHVKGTTLLLNGAGIRQQAAAPLYTAGLYLEKRATTPEEALQTQGSKQVRVVMLREVNSREFSELLSKGLVGNSSNEELSNLIPEIMDLGTLIAERGKLLPGDSFVIDWSAANGTSIRVNQRGSRKPAIEVFAKPDLISALMRIWLGAQPADAGLKAALLGKAA